MLTKKREYYRNLAEEPSTDALTALIARRISELGPLTEMVEDYRTIQDDLEADFRGYYLYCGLQWSDFDEDEQERIRAEFQRILTDIHA